MPRGGNGGNFGGGGGNIIRGNTRDNVLIGGDADELIFGRDGDDTINAGAGNDTVTGGEGADVFVVDAGTQFLTITDFENGVDRIDLSAFGINANDIWGGQYVGYLADANGDTILQFFDTQSSQMVAQVTLQGFDYTLIDPSDYIL